jgi:hypothetical protein
MTALRLIPALALLGHFAVAGARPKEHKPPADGVLLTRSVGAVAAPRLNKPARAVQDTTKVYKHEEAGVQFEAPKSWKAEPDGETITVTTPDNSLSIVFWVPSEDSFESALKALNKELGKTIKNIKSDGKPKEGELNGMDAFADGGTGDVGGTTIQWSVHLIKAKKPLIVLSFAAPGLWDKHADDYSTLVQSIKQIK